MKIAVASCVAYRDAWQPFLQLFRKFWPTCPYELLFITDEKNPGQSWCSVVAEFSSQQKQPVLLMQEDFFLNATVNELLIEKGLQQLEERKAAMVRIYPCPGGDIHYGDKWYAEIQKGTRYRVSCMASIWEPRILAEITSKCGETPFDFEISGSKLSNDYKEPFVAFRRDVQPWPLSYICSAISRGKWEPDALEFCRQQGIQVDLSLRPVA